MEDNKQSIMVEQDLRPAYYDDFRCLAEKCRYSCCKGWRISFDKKEYLALKRQKGSPEFNARMDGAIRRIRDSNPFGHYGEINLNSGKCPLQLESGLCGLQVEKGHSALPKVCRVYPRQEDYMTSGFLERSLSPSCEAVLELLWNLPEGIDFRSDSLPIAEHKLIDPVIEGPMPYWFPVVREWCVDRLQDRRFLLPERIFLMGLGLKELAEDGADIDHWMERAALLPEQTKVSGLLPSGEKELTMCLSDCLHVLLSLQSADPVLSTVPQELTEALGLERGDGEVAISVTAYQEARERFEERFRDRNYFMENLMTAVFFHLRLPQLDSPETLWKSYVNFCNLYAMYRFLAVMSCREGAPGDRDELFRLTVFASRGLIHNRDYQDKFRDELFQNGSATLAHMAILLCG